MAYATLAGSGRVVYPAYPHYIDQGTLALNATTLVIDASTEKIALIGRFWSPDYESKTIDTVSLPLGTIVSAGGSTVRVSLQDVSTTTYPAQPDGTQDQYRDVTLSSWSSGSWVTTGLLTDDGTDTGNKRTLSHGELFAVVCEFQSWTSADVLRVAGNAQFAPIFGSGSSLYTGSWATQTVGPACLFTCSDSTLAAFYGTCPRSGSILTSYHLNSTPDEYGVTFTAPCDMKVDGISMIPYLGGSSSDFEVILYQDTTALQTVAIDASTIGITSNQRWNHLPFAEKQTLTKDTEYIIAVRPTTTNAVSAPMIDVADSSHFDLWPGGQGHHLVTRTNQGSWSATTTRRFFHCSVCVTDIDVGGGGGGGPLIGGRLIR